QPLSDGMLPARAGGAARAPAGAARQAPDGQGLPLYQAPERYRHGGAAGARGNFGTRLARGLSGRKIRGLQQHLCRYSPWIRWPTALLRAWGTSGQHNAPHPPVAWVACRASELDMKMV